MSNDFREGIRQQLIDSYKPRAAEGVVCALCKSPNGPFSFHMAQFTVSGHKVPDGGVAMAVRPDSVHGSFPICVRCAPPCSQCGVPVPTECVMEFLKTAKTTEVGDYIGPGNGMCGDHIYWPLFFGAIIKRLFRQGRFGSNPGTRILKLHAIDPRTGEPLEH